MPALRDLQRDFLDGVFLNEDAILPHIRASGGLPPEKRFQIYRNNAFLILTDALKNFFPSVCALVDEKFFRFAANEFIESHPPQAGDLALYAPAFPAFLESFEPLSAHPYIADVARLEALRLRLYTAPDAAPIDPAALTNTDIMSVRLPLRPDAGLLASRWPVDEIRAMPETGQTPNINAGPIRLLVQRAGEGFAERRLSPGAFAFLSNCAKGESFAKAAEAALEAEESFDIQTQLTQFLREKIFGVKK